MAECGLRSELKVAEFVRIQVPRFSEFWRIQLFVFMLLVLAGSANSQEVKSPSKNDSPFELQTHRGKVVYLAEALKRLHNVQSVEEAKERTIAIETKDGTLIPIVEDVRGR